MALWIRLPTSDQGSHSTHRWPAAVKAGSAGIFAATPSDLPLPDQERLCGVEAAQRNTRILIFRMGAATISSAHGKFVSDIPTEFSEGSAYCRPRRPVLDSHCGWTAFARCVGPGGGG